MAGLIVLVTGVTRFIGSALAGRLADHPGVARVIGVDAALPEPAARARMGRADFARVDIRNPLVARVIEAAGVDTVVHASASSTPASSAARSMAKEMNVLGTMQLLAACQRSESVRHLIVRSTAAVYGASPRDPAIFTEEMSARSVPSSGPGRAARFDGASGKRRRWTAADQLLVDEANSLLVGTPFTYGHVVVDEAQDHSAVGLRVIGRRSPAGSLTILGDLAQSSTPAGQRDWQVALGHLGADIGEIAHLTIGYRVPAPILDMANRLLPFTGVSTMASSSVRREGEPPTLHLVPPAALAAAVAGEIIAVRHRHHNAGIVAPLASHAPLGEALAAAGLTMVHRVHDLGHDDVPVFTPEAAKGLEFDGVVVVNPHQIFDGSERGARLLYVAMTRAVQVLAFVTDEPLPSPLA